MKEISKLNKSEKIDLIKRIQAGEVSVIAGQIVERGAVLIEKDGKYYMNGNLVELEQFENIPDCTLIILPEKRKD
jgi:hypothetical protein